MSKDIIDFTARRAEKWKTKIPDKNARRLAIELTLASLENNGIWEEHATSQASSEAARIMKSMREHVGFTQSQMAAALGVSQARVSYLESGRSAQGPAIGTLYKAAFICNVELSLTFDKLKDDGDRPNVEDMRPQLQKSIKTDSLPSVKYHRRKVR